MFPQIVYACAAAPIEETILSVLKLMLVAAGAGVVFVSPVLLLVMFFIRRYRRQGFVWMIKRSLLISVAFCSLLAAGFFTYLYLDIYVFTARVTPGSGDVGGVRLVNPLCG